MGVSAHFQISLFELLEPPGMVPHLGLSFPFGPADGLGGHFQKPLGSQNPDLESWSVETVNAWGSTEVDPFAGGLTEAEGGVKVRWPVVCGLAGRMPGCLTPPFPSVPSALPVSAGSCLLPRRLDFLSGKGSCCRAWVRGRRGGGASIGVACCHSNSGLSAGTLWRTALGK